MKVSTDHWSLSLIPLLLIVRNGMSFVFPRNQFPSSSSSVSFIQRRKISTISPTYQGITSTTVQSSTDNNDSTSSETNQQIPKKEPLKPIILDPFPEAANPTYPVRGPVGEGGFMISRTGGPTEQELTDENLYKIIDRVASDLEVNTLVWKCLGYRFDPDKEEWTTAEVFPKWKERYPTPPDVIGMQRIYSKDVDGPCLRNNQALVRSIPVENKQSYLKQYMKPFGFTGYKVAELTPNLTRRAQCTNWLLFYREELFGYTIEELREKRRVRQEKAEQERLKREQEGLEDEFRPPVKEVF